jgi:hypothetical protein
MRVIIGSILVLSLFVSQAWAEQITLQVQWGFGPVPSEMLWDGEVQVSGGRLVKMQAVSFEPDKRDRMTPPTFRSFTQDSNSDGMDLIIEGDDSSRVRMKTLQGDFQWEIGELRKQRQLSFSGKDQGRLVVQLLQSLGDQPRLLSDEKSQDGDPAVCRLADGRQLVVWRAFLGLTAAEPKGDEEGSRGSGAGGDQIRASVLDREGAPGEIFDILPETGDVEAIGIAPSGGAAARIVWAQQKEGNWDLYSCTLTPSRTTVDCSPIERLTDQPGVDRNPALVTTLDGSTALVWQGWREGRSSIFFLRSGNGRWEEPLCLSDQSGNDWCPTMAASTTGATAVSWFRWQNGSYDVCLRVWEGGRWGPVQTVASSDRYEAFPSLACDGQGTLWIAYEEGRAGWGMDSNTAGLRSIRNVRLCCYRRGSLAMPSGSAALSLPTEFRDSSEMAHLATDGDGVLWLFFRRLSGRGVWEIYGTSLQDGGWSDPEKILQSAAGQDVRMATAAGADGRLRAVWVSDHRVDQVGRESYLYTSRLPSRPPRTETVETTPAPEVANAGPPLEKLPRPGFSWNGTQLGLYFGDLHRHTELSVCRTGVDGSVQDAYRYAIDAAGLDFLCITDHVQHVKILSDYDFWRTGKTADLNRVAGVHQPFYGYERSQRFPYGHRNIISLSRYVKRVPRTADNRPWSANSGYEGEQRLPPPELWDRLLGENVVTIPHTSTSPVMGTDFAYPPASMEPVIEIYQGCRYTAEHASAPDPRQERDSDTYGGKTQPAGFIWNALAKGYRYGFIASSDHVATHNSYTCVWAKDFSSEAILDALAKRQCYAATDKIQCRMQMGPHLMGSEFTAAEVPPLVVDVVGTTDIDRVDVIKDNRVVFSRRPDPPSREVSFEFNDVRPDPGVHYYYARVIQTDRNMAWVSPIWVDVARKR